MENNRLISIIMPLYNAASFVQDAIESVQSQTYTDWELIIVDDGSTDNSLQLVKIYESDKICVFTQSNSGACVARNKALSLAKGSFVKFLDADDVLLSDCLSQQIDQINELENHQIPFGNYDFIDEKSNKIHAYTFDLQSELNPNQVLFFFKHWEILITSPLHRKENLIAIGGFDEKLRRGQESDLHFRLALLGVQFVYRPTHCFSYRSHNQPSRISRNTQKNDDAMVAHSEYRLKKIELLVSGTHYNTIEFQMAFFQWRFNKARRLFASMQSEEGKLYLEQAKHSACRSKFFKVYYLLGKFVGYVNMEALFQWRLKFKKVKQSELTGIGKYV